VRGAISAVWLLVGCYHPSPASGVPCSADLECPGDQKCDTTQSPPICNGGRDANTPNIDAAVPCGTGDLCPASAPVCDANTQTCRGCVADAECASDACHEFAGTCMDESQVLYVAANGSGNCARTAPCSLDNALNQAGGSRSFVKIADGNYGNRNKIEGGAMRVIVSGADSDPAGATLGASGGGFALAVRSPAFLEGVSVRCDNDGIQDDDDLTMYRVSVDGCSGIGVHIRGGTLRMVSSRVQGGMSVGVAGEGAASTTIERSLIARNAGGGIVIDTGAITIVNSIIASNGTTLGTRGGVSFTSASPQTIDFRFNTVASNLGGDNFNTAVGVSCAKAITLGSSIFSDNGTNENTNISQLCQAHHSLFTREAAVGVGNFVGIPGYLVPNSDFHISLTSPARNAADPAATEGVDFDGEPRPQGSARDIGADEIP
jgi:parallel beta helix pectate lyase-like protein